MIDPWSPIWYQVRAHVQWFMHHLISPIINTCVLITEWLKIFSENKNPFLVQQVYIFYSLCINIQIQACWDQISINLQQRRKNRDLAVLEYKWVNSSGFMGEEFCMLHQSEKSENYIYRTTKMCYNGHFFGGITVNRWQIMPKKFFMQTKLIAMCWRGGIRPALETALLKSLCSLWNA